MSIPSADVGLDEAVFSIGIASRAVGVHTHTLRYYERLGLVSPRRSSGNVRRYSLREIQELRHVRSLTDELGINVAGVEVILRLMSRVEELEDEVEAMRRAWGTQVRGAVGRRG